MDPRITTFTGRTFRPLDPNPADVCLEDIAHALAQQCRWGGHVRLFLSVAEHCVRVSRACIPRYALLGLLHDAAEAYLVDLPKPIKEQEAMRPYREAEDRVHAAIMTHFGLAADIPSDVHEADRLICWTEGRDLMGLAVNGHPVLEERIRPWPPALAKRAFLTRFYDLGGREVSA